MTDQASGQGDTGAAGEGASFLDGIQNEDLKAHELVKDFEGKGLDDLVQGYIELKGAVPVVPEDVEGYKAEIPEGFEIDEADHGAFKEIALKQGLTNDQYQAMMQFDVARSQRIIKELNKERDDAVTEMKKEFGDGFDEKLQAAQNVLKLFKADDLADRVDLGNDPEFFRFLVNLSTAISEDKIEIRSGDREGGERPTGEDGKPILDFPSMKE